MIHENIELTGSLEISGSFVIPLGDAADRESSPSTGSLFYNTASRALETYNGNEWVTQSAGSGGGEDPVTFTASPLNYLIVAGGGGGGSRFYGGGGGGGGFLSSSIASTNSSIASGSTFTITVGAGGAASPSSGDGGNGGNSSIAATGLTTITSTGGGGGGGSTSGGSGNGDGNDGGSGGGARAWSGAHQHGYGTTGQGHRAGVSNTTHADYVPAFDTTQYSDGGSNAWGSGGGGAGEVGGNAHYMATNNPEPGKGGDGSGSAITGTNTTYAGGGGGGWNANNGSGNSGQIPWSSTNGSAPGGAGGGGAGGKGFTTPYVSAVAGTANTGGGGGAGSHSGATNGAAGGSGIVIVSYDSGSMAGAGGIKGDDGKGNCYHTFYSSDSFVLSNIGDFDIVTNGLELHWDAADFDSRGASTWSDLSGNSRNGTVSGATLGNYAYDLDGSNDYVYVANNSALEPSSNGFTIEAWINNDDVSGQDAIVAMIDSGGTYTGYYMRIHASGLDWHIYSESTTIGFINDPGTALSSNTWHHCVVTVDGTATGANMATYIDGVQQQTATTTGAYDVLSGEQFQVGRYNFAPSTRWFNGEIAQIRVYSTGLTQAQVTQNYNATKTNFV